MNYAYIIGENSTTLFNTKNGNSLTIFDDDPRYDAFNDLIQAGDYEGAERFDVKTVINDFVGKYTLPGFNITIKDGVGEVVIGNDSYPINGVIVDRIVKMEKEGFSARPLVNFLCNLYSNPSKQSIDELFLFLDHSELPITTDGHFIAYKIVKSDFMDIYTGKMDNSVGKVVEMPRFAVDDVRTNTCSAGLHFCSKEYLDHYGTSNRDNDVCVIVKINPADVVSIPVDYNNAKGRTCKYEVVGVLDTGWRQSIPSKDYNTSSVVTDTGDDILEAVDVYFDVEDHVWRNADTEEAYSEEDLFVDGTIAERVNIVKCKVDDSELEDDEDDSDNYYFDSYINRWRDSEDGRLVSRSFMMKYFECDADSLAEIEKEES